MTPLCKLMVKYGSDKAVGGSDGLCHDYSEYYHEVLKDIRDKVTSVLEIGIYKGASLRAWRDYFPNAKITGLDVRKDRLIFEDRIESRVCDQNDEVSLIQAVDGNEFDIVIDDGCHTTHANATAFKTIFPYTKQFYFIEDVAIDRVEDTVKRASSDHRGIKILNIDRNKKGLRRYNRILQIQRA